tara:strand:- start:32 stop:514 length:483 start_codon:yes stop_codon:yes gene_type:complete
MTLQDCQQACPATSTWNCDGQGMCSDPGNGNGTYASLAACLANCTTTPTWNCDGQGNCSDPGNGNGTYASLAACQANCNITYINDTKTNEIRLYPNPVTNILNINTDKEISKIEIFDALGRIILSKSDNTNTIDVSELENGIYSIAIIFNSNKIIKRFSK